MQKILVFVIIGFLITLSSTVWSQEEEWVELNPANPPSDRFGHSMVTLSDGRVLLFGGEGENSVLLNDVHVFNDGEWSQVATNNPPPARRDHGAWVSNDQMLVHGGLGAGQQALNDLWRYNPDTNSWTEVQQVGPRPSARFGHTTTIASDGLVYILAGTANLGNNLADLWRLNADNSYTQLSPAPTLYTQHITHEIGGFLFVFGLPGVVSFYNISQNMWIFSQTGPPIQGNAPSVAAQNDEGQTVVYIFGGLDAQGNESNIVYEFNTTTFALTQREESMPFPLSQSGGVLLPPSERDGEPIPGIQVLVFGGISGGQIVGTSIQFFSEGAPPPPPPPPPAVSDVLNQIGGLGKGRLALLFVQFPDIQDEVNLEVTWRQKHADLCLLTYESNASYGRSRRCENVDDLVRLTATRLDQFDITRSSNHHSRRGHRHRGPKTITKTVRNTQNLLIVVKHIYHSAPAYNIQLKVSGMDDNPDHVLYGFPVGKFDWCGRKTRLHFVRFGLEPTQWCSRYPHGTKGKEKTLSGEDFWEWRFYDRTPYSCLYFPKFAFVRFSLP
jgi:hypothetical protein